MELKLLQKMTNQFAFVITDTNNQDNDIDFLFDRGNFIIKSCSNDIAMNSFTFCSLIICKTKSDSLIFIFHKKRNSF